MGCNNLILHMIIYIGCELLKTPKDQILLEINPKFEKGKIGVKHGEPFMVRSTGVSSDR